MSNPRRNNTRHYLITVDGETFAEKCRNSLGGWQNLEARINERFGRTIRDADRLRVADPFAETLEWSIAGHAVTIEEVCKL